MTPFDNYREPLSNLRDLLPRLVEMLEIEDAVSGTAWKNLDARLLPLVDPRLPLMVAICGGRQFGQIDPVQLPVEDTAFTGAR